MHRRSRSIIDKEPIHMKPGDYVNIPAHRKHRVEWFPNPATFVQPFRPETPGEPGSTVTYGSTKLLGHTGCKGLRQLRARQSDKTLSILLNLK